MEMGLRANMAHALGCLLPHSGVAQVCHHRFPYPHTRNAEHRRFLHPLESTVYRRNECSKIGIINQLLFAQINRNHFLLTQAKSNCGSLILFLSTHSTSKLSSTQEDTRIDSDWHCVRGDMGTCVCHHISIVDVS